MVRQAIEFLVTTLLDSRAIALGLGPLEIRTEIGRWVVGTGEPPSGDAQAAFATAAASPPCADQPPRRPAVSGLEVSAFELFRAATGRRSRAQIRGYPWREVPEPYLSLFDLSRFNLRGDDLVE